MQQGLDVGAAYFEVNIAVPLTVPATLRLLAD